jgi:hypothetical protein
VIDTQNQKNWPGHIKAITDLPVNDSGFIVAANIDLRANDSSLLNSQTPTQNLTPTITQNNPFNLGNLTSLWPIAIAIIIVICLIFAIFWIFPKKQKTI